MIREWRELGRFRKLEASNRAIVFYAEEGSAFVHFEHIIAELTQGLNRQICYVTSSSNDSVLQREDPNILTFHIGFGSARTVFFRTLQADVMVMTMPDLNTFHIKTSAFPVHYVYVHHSMVSTHMVYRNGAFDHFTSILCVGPHHVAEILAREKQLNLPEKHLIEHGYGRLDSVIKATAQSSEPLRPSAESKQGTRVLIAPSWGDDALLETCGMELVSVLSEAGYQTVVRPHPMTIKTTPRVFRELVQRFESDPNVTFDLNMSSHESLSNSDIMISDWSGAAFEYAFGFERPVLFVDVPRKINNPDYESLSLIPVEVSIRTEIGDVVSPDNLDGIPGAIAALCADQPGFVDRVRRIREQTVFNVGQSGEIGAEYLAQIANLAAADPGR